MCTQLPLVFHNLENPSERAHIDSLSLDKGTKKNIKLIIEARKDFSCFNWPSKR